MFHLYSWIFSAMLGMLGHVGRRIFRFLAYWGDIDMIIDLVHFTTWLFVESDHILAVENSSYLFHGII